MSDIKYHAQQCQDDLINTAFRHLHENIINEIIGFCKAWNISIDEFHLNADCLEDSIKVGSWQPCTDSCFEFDKFTDEYKDVISMKKTVDNKEWETIKLNQKPFMISM